MNSIYKDQNYRDYKPKNDNFMKKKNNEVMEHSWGPQLINGFLINSIL